jgi:hypothetical protein
MNMVFKVSDLKRELRAISDDPRYIEPRGKLAKFEREIETVRKTIDALNAEWYSRQSGTVSEDAIDVADRMLDGRNIDTRDTPARLRDLSERLAVLRPAVCRQRELVDRLRGELSVEAGKIVQTRHRKALVKILEAARLLAEAGAAERAIRGELLDLGYQSLDAFMPAPRLAALHIMGDESWHDSPISHYRRQLEELEIAP